MANGADYVFMFNSDAVAEAGCVRELVAAALVRPTAAFFGPLILRETAPECVESAGQPFNRWTGRHREANPGGQRAADVELCPRTVDAISGCALLVRRAAVEVIGLLDESLFIYFEDMDWCLRASGAGYESVVVPRARVLHLGQGSTGGSSAFTTFTRSATTWSSRRDTPSQSAAGWSWCWRLAITLRTWRALASAETHTIWSPSLKGRGQPGRPPAGSGALTRELECVTSSPEGQRVDKRCEGPCDVLPGVGFGDLAGRPAAPAGSTLPRHVDERFRRRADIDC